MSDFTMDLNKSGLTSENVFKKLLKGKYCIARCHGAGVHAGEVVELEGETVILKNSRRLWSWTAQKGIALSGVAQHGIVESGSKIDSLNPEILLNGVCELIVCTDEARATIDNA